MKATYQGNEIGELYLRVIEWRDRLQVAINNAKFLAETDIKVYKETPWPIRLFKTNPEHRYDCYCSKSVQDYKWLRWEIADLERIVDKINFALTTNAFSVILENEEIQFLRMYNEQ